MRLLANTHRLKTAHQGRPVPRPRGFAEIGLQVTALSLPGSSRVRRRLTRQASPLSCRLNCSALALPLDSFPSGLMPAELLGVGVAAGQLPVRAAVSHGLLKSFLLQTATIGAVAAAPGRTHGDGPGCRPAVRALASGRAAHERPRAGGTARARAGTALRIDSLGRKHAQLHVFLKE